MNDNSTSTGAKEQQRFLNQFHIDGALFQISVGRRGSDDKLKLRDQWYKSVPEITEVPTDQHVFFAPAQRKTQGSLKTDVYGTVALWVDIDNAQRDHIPESTLPPSAVVWSGHGYHLYWFFNRTLKSPRAIESYNKILIRDIEGADQSCWNANRLMRVPDTWNIGDRGKHEDPTKCVIVHSRAVVYDWDDIDALAALDLRTRALIIADGRGDFKSRSERDFSAVGGLVSAGASESLIERIFMWSPIGDKMREHNDPHHYIITTIESVRTQIADMIEADPVLSKALSAVESARTRTHEYEHEHAQIEGDSQPPVNLAAATASQSRESGESVTKPRKKQGRIQGAQILAKDNGY